MLNVTYCELSYIQNPYFSGFLRKPTETDFIRKKVTFKWLCYKFLKLELQKYSRFTYHEFIGSYLNTKGEKREQPHLLSLFRYIWTSLNISLWMNTKLL